PPQPRSTLFPYTTLFRSGDRRADGAEEGGRARRARPVVRDLEDRRGERRPRGDESLLARGFDVGREQERREPVLDAQHDGLVVRSEEHTSELQSPCNLVC